MGLEANCEARIAGRPCRGHARLEEKELVFRAEAPSGPRLRVALRRLRGVSARAGVLSLELDGHVLRLSLGEQAERWARRIAQPPGLAQKLGVKPGARVCLLRCPEPELEKLLRTSGAEVSTRPRRGCDLVIAYFAGQQDLVRLRRLRESLPPAGALWAIWRKGRKELREDDLRAAALPLGLVDVKVASVSETLSGLKLMIRREQRGSR